MNTKKKIDLLRSKIDEYNYSYYVLDKSIISDFEFDSLLDELIRPESENPQYFDENSPTQREVNQLRNLIMLDINIKCYHLLIYLQRTI